MLDEVNGLVAYERLLSYISSDKGLPARVQSLLPKLLVKFDFDLRINL